MTTSKMEEITLLRKQYDLDVRKTEMELDRIINEFRHELFVYFGNNTGRINISNKTNSDFAMNFDLLFEFWYSIKKIHPDEKPIKKAKYPIPCALKLVENKVEMVIIDITFQYPNDKAKAFVFLENELKNHIDNFNVFSSDE